MEILVTCLVSAVLGQSSIPDRVVRNAILELEEPTEVVHPEVVVKGVSDLLPTTSGASRARLLGKRALGYLAIGKNSDAVKDLEDALAILPMDPDLGCTLGKALLVEKKSEAATQLIDKLIILHPKHARVRFLKAALQMHNQQPDAAMESFTKAISLDPHYSPSFYNRAMLHAQRGDNEAALRDIDESIRLKPIESHPELPYLIKATVLGRLQRYDEALRYFQSAVQLNNQNIEAHVGLCTTYLELEKPNTAAYLAVQLLRGNLERIDVINVTVRVLSASGHLVQAAEVADYALKSPKRDSETFRMVGELRIRQKKYKEALSLLRNACQGVRNNDPAYISLAGFLASCPDEHYRDGKEAMRIVAQWPESTLKTDPSYLAVSAMAHAASGDFRGATTAVEYGLAKLRQRMTPAMVTSYQRMLANFKQGKPARIDE